jgi:F-type H+-transporting ATPase subunit delta
MRDVSIATNYAETLLTLAQRAHNPEDWGVMFGDVAAAIEHDPRLKRFLESPRVSEAQKNEVLAKAFQDRLPRLLVRFLQMVVHHRRQRLIGEIAIAYDRLLDTAQGRVRADVTVARPLDAAGQAALADRLTRAMGEGQNVVPVVRLFPPILGGVIVRIGDRVADGSVRTRLARLRRRLAAAH